jgi:hypothetical protein
MMDKYMYTRKTRDTIMPESHTVDTMDSHNIYSKRPISGPTNKVKRDTFEAKDNHENDRTDTMN